MIRRFSILLLIILKAIPLFSNQNSIELNLYEEEEYRRHPIMEEADRIAKRKFQFREGLEIISEMPDIEIYIFGEKAGRTPWESDSIQSGNHIIRLEKNGFVLKEIQVRVESGKRTVLYINEGLSKGELNLIGLSHDSLVYLDGKIIESDTLRLDAGRYYMRIETFGRQSIEEIVLINPSEIKNWVYTAEALPFQIHSFRIRPEIANNIDKQGFQIIWEVSGPGTGRLTARHSQSNEIVFDKDLQFRSANGRIRWNFPRSSNLPSGDYILRIEAGNPEDGYSSKSTSLRIDKRYTRSLRNRSQALPGLLYAPGSAMLPPKILQIITGIAYQRDAELPLSTVIRFSPAERWEFSGRLVLTPDALFNDAALGFSLAASWRLNPGEHSIKTNLALTFEYDAFLSSYERIRENDDSTHYSGMELTLPMELQTGILGFILTPALHIILIDQIGDPLRAAASLSAGSYLQRSTLFFGLSASLRTPDVSAYLSDWYFRTGADFRIHLPDNASYIGISAGLKAYPKPESLNIILEFGITN